jgi:ribonucleotide reductase beta subunit family protein with ferritin-like domain
MQRDIELWQNPNSLPEDERRIVKRNLGFFMTADSLGANDIVLDAGSAAGTCCARSSKWRSTLHLPVYRRAGLNAPMLKSYLHLIANRCAVPISLEPPCPNEEKPFPMMSEMINMKKERNFFETTRDRISKCEALIWPWLTSCECCREKRGTAYHTRPDITRNPCYPARYKVVYL